MLTVPYEVKQALKKGRMRKEYKFKVYDDSNVLLFTMDNDNLVAESVKIDERMCSDKIIKFGLCEGSSLEFQYFNHDNINGKQIQAFLSVEYIDSDNEVAWYDIPMGWFTVDSCSKQFSTGIHKVTAFNKLKSEYLDSDVKDEALSLITTGTPKHSNELPINILLNDLLNGYGVLTNYSSEELVIGEVEDSAGVEINNNGYPVYPEDTSLNEKYLYKCHAYLYIGINNVSTDNIYEIVLKNINALKEYYHQRYDSVFEGYYVDQARTVTIWDDIDNLVFTDVRSVLGGTPPNVQSEQLFPSVFSSTSDTFLKLCTDVTWTQTYGVLYEYSFFVCMPILMKISDNAYENNPWTTNQIDAAYQEVTEELQTLGFIEIRKLDSEIGDYRITTSDISSVNSLTLRELQSAVYELDTQYGQLDRETDLFTGVELNGGGLYPATTLYPSTTLYPNQGGGNNVAHPFPSEYKKLWTDTVGVQSFRYLNITYKGLDENNQEKDFILQRTVNADGTTDYNMSDNWLFRNLVWDAADVGDYADAMVLKMQDIKWFPFEMWAAGLPYVETGDAIEITDKEGDTYVSYILQRQLNGIQNLQDTYINGELDIF